MAKKFNTHVAVHRDPADVVWFAPGDEVPDWALELVGDHVYGGNHEAEEVDVRLTDPENEPDDPEGKFQTAITLPPEEGGTVEDLGDDSDEDLEEEVDLDKLTKAELIALAEEADLDTSGTKAELIARLAD